MEAKISIFLDTSDLDKIREFNNFGIIRGVTTNPTILKKNHGLKSIKELKQIAIEISEIIAPYPLSIEVNSNDYDEMLEQAKLFSEWHKNINVKITIHGPDGESYNLKAINIIENKFKIKVNVTAMMSAQQCLLAMYAGASYVSLFGGRINNIGHSAIDEISKTRELIDLHGFKSKIIVGSVREAVNVSDWLIAGAHIVTTTPEILEVMLVHPYTKETVKQFMIDGEQIIK